MLTIGPHSIRAEIANTSHSRHRGLMHVHKLCSNCGMLFVFPKAGKHSFWMKDTPLSLSVAFVASDGRILNILDMEAFTLQSHSSQGDALYALEMNKGWFAAHGIKPLQHIQGLHHAPRGN